MDSEISFASGKTSNFINSLKHFILHTASMCCVNPQFRVRNLPLLRPQYTLFGPQGGPAQLPALIHEQFILPCHSEVQSRALLVYLPPAAAQKIVYFDPTAFFTSRAKFSSLPLVLEFTLRLFFATVKANNSCSCCPYDVHTLFLATKVLLPGYENLQKLPDTMTSEASI